MTSQKDLTVKQVADLTQQSPYVIGQLLRRGAFPGAYKAGVGGKSSPWRIPPRALDIYRAKQPHAV